MAAYLTLFVAITEEDEVVLLIKEEGERVHFRLPLEKHLEVVSHHQGWANRTSLAKIVVVVCAADLQGQNQLYSNHKNALFARPCSPPKFSYRCPIPTAQCVEKARTTLNNPGGRPTRPTGRTTGRIDALASSSSVLRPHILPCSLALARPPSLSPSAALFLNPRGRGVLFFQVAKHLKRWEITN